VSDAGVFVQFTCHDAVDFPVPGRKYTFGVVKAAPARGDFDVLVERNRCALRAHLGADVAAGLSTLRSALLTALGSAPNRLHIDAARCRTLFKVVRTRPSMTRRWSSTSRRSTYERRRASLGLLLIGFFNRFELGQ
jgi:hypothetical protein